MKKTYSKPDIVFESFSLCTSIAAGCEAPVESDGTVKFGRVSLFTNELEACGRKPNQDGAFPEYNGLCYHNPSETYNAFTS